MRKLARRAVSFIVGTIFLCVLLAGCCCSVPSGVGGGYTPQPSPHIVDATDADFVNIVFASDKPVVVDFWAPWCGPCAMLDPTVVKLAEEFKDRVKFVRVNVDGSPKVAADYQVNSIPMLGFFHEGKLLEKQVGVQAENSLRRWLINLLKSLETES